MERIQTVNSTIFNRKNLNLTYKSKCSTSWLEVEIVKEDFNNIVDAENNNKNVINEVLNNNDKDNDIIQFASNQ